MRHRTHLLVLLAAALLAFATSVAAAATPAPLHAGSTGQRVRDASYLLQGHNVFRLRTFTGPIVSTYGAALGQASARAKWRLGYPAAHVTGTFGSLIRAYLMGLQKLPADYVARRNVRIASLVTESYPLARKAAIIGVPGVGTHSYTSPPNNWQSDRAVDLAAPVGTPVLAIAAGHICDGCGFGPFDVSLGSRFNGNRLTLVTVDAQGRELDRAYYAHLSRYAVGITPGVRVHVGQVLGYTGTANGVAHLHWALMISNPLAWVERTQPATSSSYGLLEWPNLAGLIGSLALLAVGHRRRRNRGTID
jgi:murein DD-endopeptidase MepM/ murein hydrolase activator NlpD